MLLGPLKAALLSGVLLFLSVPPAVALPTALAPVEVVETEGEGEVEEEEDEVPIPHIPEPLLFDLMRPLHAKRGEIEVNTLGVISRGSKLHWAPEVEWAIADGVAIEFEFPFANSRYDSTKLGLQFRMGHDAKAVHGIQLLTEIGANADYQTSLSALYLFGYRFNDKWSLMSMTGAQAVVGGPESNEWRGLQNLTLFHDTTESITTGLEVNWAFTGRDLLEQFEVTPQLHWSLSESSMIQVGAGVAKTEHDRWVPQYALRVIRQL